MMRSKLLIALTFSFIAQVTHADDQMCIANFSTEGGFFKGKTFKTWDVVKGVEEKTAFKKIYLYITKDGWKINNADKEMGIISASQDVSYGDGKTAPLNVIIEPQNKSDTKVTISYSVSGGVTSPEDAVKDAFCKMTNAARQ